MIFTGRLGCRKQLNEMKDGKLFLILDIDGVLLEAHGYRLACMDTINDFLSQMGQPQLSVDRVITDRFEASGISCEWDMVPLALAAFVNFYCSITGEVLPDVFPPRCEKTVFPDNDAFKRMLLRQINEYSNRLAPDETGINAIYRTYREADGRGLEALWKQPFRERFFVDTLDPWKCPMFAGLMNRLLGSEEFLNFYGLEPPFECESYLETKDQLLISEENRSLLPGLPEKGIFPVVMTYRPTKYPEKAGNKGKNYFVNDPEGECALRLLGWTDDRVRMVGTGSLCYIEEKYGLRREKYVKPHPFHALASVMTSVCDDELEALEIAHGLCVYNPSITESPASGLFLPGEKLKLAVFEDSVSGMQSVRNAAEVLRKWGYDASAILCGIRTTEEKTQFLADTGAALYDSFNDALADVIRERLLKCGKE